MAEPRKGAEVQYMAVQVGKTYIINTAPGVWYKGKIWRNAPRIITNPTTPWDETRSEWDEGRTLPDNKTYPADRSMHFYELPGVEEASVEGAAGGKRRRRKSRRSTRRRGKKTLRRK